jgi:hypothetical protein
MTTHSISYYKETTVVVSVGVKIIFVPTPHSSGVGSCGNSKMH